MLQRIRQHRSLRAVVVSALVLAWLAALFAGVQTRLSLAQALPWPQALCGPAAGPAAPEAHAAHALGGAGDAPAKHAHHHDPDCLLCIALATPPAARFAAVRSPVPLVHEARRGVEVAVPVWRAMAPLPARGPPGSIHA
jgi:hypothetical protein